jgi:hypothetical protein
MFSVVSKTKKASPPSPSFMEKLCLTSLTTNSTCAGQTVEMEYVLQVAYLFIPWPQKLELAEAHVECRACKTSFTTVRRGGNALVQLPNSPSSCSTTMTSIAPERVAGFIEL